MNQSVNPPTDAERLATLPSPKDCAICERKIHTSDCHVLSKGSVSPAPSLDFPACKVGDDLQHITYHQLERLMFLPQVKVWVHSRCCRGARALFDPESHGERRGTYDDPALCPHNRQPLMCSYCTPENHGERRDSGP